MRLFGERHWFGGTRLALGVACVVLLAFASSASAVTRYAAPAGATIGTCAVATPCELEYAVETAAGAGDEIRVTSGTYSITSAIVAGSSKILRGDGATRPRLVGIGGLSGAPVTVQGGASIQNLRIESQNASPALDLDGTGNDLELYSTGGDAARVRGSSDLTTAVVTTSAPNATALALTDGLLAGATVRHATIVATGSGSTGLDASGLNLLGIGAPLVVSSIVKGASTDVAGALLNTINLDYSAYRFASSTGVAANDGSNVNAAALLVNPAGGDFQQQGASPTVNAGSNPDGAAVDLAGNPRSIAGAPDIGALELPIPPDATTGSTSGVTGTTATIHGTVATQASATDFQFYWGTSNPPSSGTPLRSLPASSAGGNYSENITGLKPGTAYYYRVVATSAWGTTEGAVASFSTPSIAPTATTNPASLVTATSARLNAAVNPGGAATSVEYHWGTDTSYASQTASQSFVSGTNNISPTANLSGLLPNTEYHYRVVASNANGTAYGADQTFTTPVRAPVVPAPTHSAVTSTSASLSGSIDPGGAVTSWSFEYGVGTAYDTSLPGTDVSGTGAQPVSDALTGLLPGTTYGYRIVAQNSAGTAVSSAGQFTTSVAAPTATTNAATGILAHRVKANADLNPGGGPTTVYFEYAKTLPYNRSTAAVNVPAGTDPVSVGVALSGLAPATVYHYRVVVENSSGIAYGSDVAFTTAPERPDVVTGIATSITQDGAQLAATVGTGGADTTYEFEYGQTAGYGATSAAGNVAAADGSAQVTAPLTALEAGTRYHYRVVARNVAGTTVGSDMTFTTQAAPQTDPPPGTDDAPPADDAGDSTASPDGPVQADGLPAPDPAPPVGESANAAPSSGTIRVRLPGSSEYVELTEGAGIPIGSTVDASKGEVVITSASDKRGGTQTAAFTGSEFKLAQKKAAKPITDIVLTGGNLNECTPRILSKIGDVEAAGRRKWSRRRLWGNGHGRFRTRGRNGTATVRGTWWLTEDRCDGTLVRVKRGLVEVRDLQLRKTVMVPAGEDYFAKSTVARKARAKKPKVKRAR
ncbi:MAG: hypothetical protein QOF29_112 [bacterium]